MNEMKLTIDNEVFDTMRKNFDVMLERTVGSMIMRNADESTLTLKICISLDKKTVPADGGGFREVTQPSFKHDLSSVMQVKDKMSGTFKGNVELIFDENGKPIVRDIDDGQMKIWDDDGLVSVDEETDADSNLRALPAGTPGLPAPVDAEYSDVTDTEEEKGEDKEDKTEAPSTTPYDWLFQYRNKVLRCQNKSGVYNVVANSDGKILVSSGYMKDSPFYIDAEKLKPHVGENLICVTSPENADDPDAIEIWCEDCGAYLFGIQNPAHMTENVINTPDESGKFDDNENEGYKYDAPEEEEAEG